jgi:hypothetical protein
MLGAALNGTDKSPIQQTIGTPTMSCLDDLRRMANHAVADYWGDRRPTWAPPLVLDGELVSVLRELRMLSDKPVARLWAQYTSPKYGDLQCVGFELRAGTNRSGKKFFETSVSYADIRGSITVQPGTWHNGPRWRSPEEAGGLWATNTRWISEYPLRVRAAELGGRRVLEFASAPCEQMQLGGVLCAACAICGKALTDAISRERGIGPECRARFGAWLRARTLGERGATQARRPQETSARTAAVLRQPPFRPCGSPPWGEP